MNDARLSVWTVLVCVAIAALAVGSFATGLLVGRTVPAAAPVAAGPGAPGALEARLAALEQRVVAMARAGERPAPAPAREAAPQPAALAPDAVRSALALDGAPARGPEDAPVTIVEFADFQCPFCSRVDATLQQLIDAYPQQVRLVFKHFPLPIHPQAMDAHKAALAAGDQGRFWEMHDRIFAAPTALDRATLVGYARDLGLDVPAFEAALDAPGTEARIRRDVAEGGKVGVRGTPTFFINGRLLSGAQPLEAFRSQVEQALADARAPTPVAMGGAR